MKDVKFIIGCLLIVSFGIARCTTTASDIITTKNSPSKNRLTSTDEQRTPVRVEFNNADLFKIISLSKTNNYPSSFEDTSICVNWDLNKDNLPSALQSFKKISTPEWHYSYDHLPCAYEGELLYNGITYPFSINGGSWLTISYPDSVLRYGCKDSSCTDYYLSSPNE